LNLGASPINDREYRCKRSGWKFHRGSRHLRLWSYAQLPRSRHL